MSLLEDPAVPHTKSMGVQREMSHFPALLPPVEAKQATNPTELILNQDLHLFKRKERKTMAEFGGNVVSFVGGKESSLGSVCFLVITSFTKLPCMHIQKHTLCQ